MASGFIILNDGRCLAPRYTGYDYLLELAIAEMNDEGDAGAFKTWLTTQIPSPGDIDNVLGGFIRAGVRKLILTRDEKYSHLIFLLKRILRMRRLVRANGDPDQLSDWRKGIIAPPTGVKTGPGW